MAGLGLFHTVGGRNPAPVEVGSLCHSSQGFIHRRWLFGFFFHEQYVSSPEGFSADVVQSAHIGTTRLHPGRKKQQKVLKIYHLKQPIMFQGAMLNFGGVVETGLYVKYLVVWNPIL